MAKRGRGGSGDFQARIGSFFASALQGLGSVREAVTQQAKEGKSQLDLALLRRRRKAALADLGAAVARLAADGTISEDDFPELSGPLARLEAIDEQIDGRGGRSDDDDAVRGWRGARDAGHDDDDRDDDDRASTDEELDDDAAYAAEVRRRAAEDAAEDDAVTAGKDADPYDDSEPTSEDDDEEPYMRRAADLDDDDGRYDPPSDDDDPDADIAASVDDAAAADDAGVAKLDDDRPGPDEQTRDGRPKTRRR